MPAASEPATGGRLPVTFRPVGIRVAAVVLGVLLFAVTAVVWLAFPEEVRDAFTFLQRLTVIGFGLAAAFAGYAMGRSRIEAREDGLLVVNGLRSHHYRWGEVDRVTLRAGGPWAILELTDGTTAPAMGIQGSDGARAVAQVKQLRAIMRDLAAGGHPA